MNAATVPKRMTLEEFLALPDDDGVERWLIRGELREKQDTDMTRRNKSHSITEANVTGLLWVWMRSQPEPRVAVACGEAGIILRRHPETVSAGVDVAIITAEQADTRDPDTNMIVGPPVLIAEVRSPNDTDEEISERVEEYLDCGVPLVWIISTHFRTVTVHRPGVDPVALDARDTLTGDPELQGFSCPVADFFR